MNENIIKLSPNILTILGFIIAAVIAFYKIRNDYDKALSKLDKDLSEKISKLEVEIAHLKGKDENQQQIIDQFQIHILNNLPKVSKTVNNHSN